MLYIVEIELLNFVQLKGKKYHKFYDPFYSYVFIGPNGSGKSSIMAEHDPRPMVHGYTTILKDFEGMKKIIYRDTDDRSYGLKVVHYYTPKKVKKEDELKYLKSDVSKHTVTSFLYELHYDDVVNTVVNGQTSQFKEVCAQYFGLSYDAIPITTIGVKFGRNTFNLMSCNDIDRYNYLKMVLKSVDEVKSLEDIINNKAQIINRRIKDYKSIISSISQSDFEGEIQKLKLDIHDYDEQRSIHADRKVRLGVEYDSISSVSMSDRDAYVKEFQELKLLYSSVGYDSYIEKYEMLYMDFNSKYAEKQNLLKVISELNHNIAEIVKANPSDKRFDIQCLEEDISVLRKEVKDEISYDISAIDKAQSTLNMIHNLISKITMYPDIIFEDVFKYNNSLEIQAEVNRTQHRMNKLYTSKSDLQAETISDTDRAFFIKGNVPFTKNCEQCSMYQTRIEIEEKMVQLEKNAVELSKIYSELEEVNVYLNKLERIQSLFNYVVDLRRLIDDLDDVVIKDLAFNVSVEFFFNNIEQLEDRLKSMKYDAMNQIRLRDMTNRLNILIQDDSMKKLDEYSNELQIHKMQLGVLESSMDKINQDSLFNISKEVAYKYASVDRSKRMNELHDIIQKLSSISEKSRNLENEMGELDKAIITLNGLLERKSSELMKIQIEKARFEENTTNYKNELVRSKKAEKLKTLLSKKIPTIFLNLYMIYVKDEANEFLADTGRYRLGLPEILYDEDTKRNTFFIPISDNGELKSCSVLSKGEDNIMNIAVTLPLIYIASDKYRIPRMDEMDSTLDVFMKKLQMDKVMNLDPEKISQLFMVSHSPREFFDTYDRCRIIDLTTI